MAQPKKPLTEYEKARALWYKKLEKDGQFVDIEDDHGNLKVWSAKLASKGSLDLQQSKEEYYKLATNFLNDYAFPTNMEKTIWEYRAEGLSVREIVKTLQKARFKKLSSDTLLTRDSVWKVIKRLETAMKAMYLSRSSEQP